MLNAPTPSFALEATTLLANKQAMDAALLCAQGLEFYPDYLGGYLVLAEAYAALNRPEDADVILEAARSRFSDFEIVLRHQEVAPVVIPEPPKAPIASTTSDSKSTPSVLRLIETVPHNDDQRIIRSTSVRLIPGLEYTSLRFEGTRSRGRRMISPLPDPPPFRSFHSLRRMSRPAEPVSEKRPVSLEELAKRLELAKIPRNIESLPTPAPAVQPSGPVVMTETIANIYMQQGSFDKAIEAFRLLQSVKPDRVQHFEEMIAACEKSKT